MDQIYVYSRVLVEQTCGTIAFIKIYISLVL